LFTPLHDPPQSWSVSPPFVTLSLQAGAEHVLAVAWQTPLVQSPPDEQLRLTAQRAVQMAPPQSASVSSCDFTPSVQVGAHFFVASQ